MLVASIETLDTKIAKGRYANNLITRMRIKREARSRILLLKVYNP